MGEYVLRRPISINYLWDCTAEECWKTALDDYWSHVKIQNRKLEEELEHLDSIAVSKLSAEEFYDFLYSKYFVWKYTAPNRLATTRMNLQKHLINIDRLGKIKSQIFLFDLENPELGLKIVTQINGLGTAGASGLLSLLFPKYFATVDQFTAKALYQIESLTERDALKGFNPEGLSLKAGALLIGIMKEKAHVLNQQFQTDFWTPRKIDKILWGIGR
ncbi:hypothetical protein [Caproiciproducens sp.]